MMSKIFTTFNVVFVSLIVIGVLFLSSCSRHDDLADDLRNQRSFVVSDVDTQNQHPEHLVMLQNRVDEINKKNLITKSTPVIFDKDKIIEKNIEGTKINFFVIPQVGCDENNAVNFGASFLVDDGKIKFTCVVKEERLKENSKRITYLNDNLTPLLEVYIDDKNENITTNYILKNMIKTKSESDDTGDCVVRCLDRMYTEGSWASVVLWCTSAVCWQVPAAVAITCAIECGTDYPSPGYNQ